MLSSTNSNFLLTVSGVSFDELKITRWLLGNDYFNLLYSRKLVFIHYLVLLLYINDNDKITPSIFYTFTIITLIVYIIYFNINLSSRYYWKLTCYTLKRCCKNTNLSSLNVNQCFFNYVIQNSPIHSHTLSH